MESEFPGICTSTHCLKYLHTYIKLCKFRAAVQEELRLRKKKKERTDTLAD